MDNAIAAIAPKPRGLPQAVTAPEPAEQAPPSVPTHLVPAFEAAAEKHGVPVAALMAAAEARSGFQTHRITPEGRGIMRLPRGGGINPSIPNRRSKPTPPTFQRRSRPASRFMT